VDTTTRVINQEEQALWADLHNLRVARMRAREAGEEEQLAAEIYRKKRELLVLRRSLAYGSRSARGLCVDRYLVRMRGVGLKGSLWPSNQTVIEVGFVQGSVQQRQLVMQIASEWNRWSGLPFVFVDHGQAGVRVGFDPELGSWSYIGTDCLGVEPPLPTMNLGWLHGGVDLAEARRVILHEFGHVLGLGHEHQSPAAGIPWDKEAVYRFFEGPPNRWNREEVDRNVFAVYDRDQVRGFEFDRDSIMLYPIPAELTGGRLAVDWNSELSEGDKRYIARMYGE